jgi:hypothetical protein
MIGRPRSTASAHVDDGSDCVTDGTFCGSGCRGVAVVVMYKWRPIIATGTKPTATTISRSHVSIRFRLFDTFPPLRAFADMQGSMQPDLQPRRPL